MRFWKMHGLGNDFVVVDTRGGEALLPAQAMRLADRRYGVGCDQVLELVDAEGEADVKMLVHNPDGSRAGTCGNGLRCVAWWLYVVKVPGACEFRIETSDRVVAARIEEGLVRLDMGAPSFHWRDVPLAEDAGEPLRLGIDGLPDGVALSVGNPHAVFEVADAEHFEVVGIGPLVERHRLFPQRVNVEFVTRLAPDVVRMRVWERGAGLTPACGSGATAVAAVMARRKDVAWPLTVRLDGGDLRFTQEGTRLVMQGPAQLVFAGEMGVFTRG